MKKLINQQPGNISKLFFILWGIGNGGGGLIVGITGAFQMLYYQNYLGMSADMYSLCIILYTSINAFINPVFAYVSDRTKSRLGRRVPYFRLSAPIVAISFAMLFFVPLQANLLVKFWWLFLCLIIFDIAYSMYCNMYMSLQAEITEHENERISLQLSQDLNYYIGNIIGMILPSYIASDFGSEQATNRFRISIIIIAAVALTFFLITAFVVKERKDLSPKPASKNKLNVVSVIKEYIRVFSIKPLRKAIFISFFSNGAVSITTPLLYYVAMFMIFFDPGMFSFAVMLPMLVGLPIWMKIQRRFKAIKTAEIALLLTAFALISAALIPNKYLTIVFFALAGFAISGYRMTLKTLYFDCVDFDEYNTGMRKEGVVFGAASFINVFTFVLATIIPQVLERTGFISAAENGGVNELNQPLTVIWGIKGLILFCALLVFIAYILLLAYPLKGEKLREVREHVLKMHSENEKK